MAKYKQHTAGEGGWSEWEKPKMKGYRMCCCDCDLIHEFEFGVVVVTERLPDGYKVSKVSEDPNLEVIFRVKRNNRATAAKRRKAKK